MSPIEWVIALGLLSASGACLWWAMRAIERGHKAEAEIKHAEDHRDEAIERRNLAAKARLSDAEHDEVVDRL